jgi:hypothetical protein
MEPLKIISWVLFVDSLGAGYIAWLGNKDYFNKINFFKRYLPLTKGWTAGYIILVLFIGYLVYFN